MNHDLPISLLIAAFTGALMLLLPHISPHRYFFAITVPADFRASAAGRSSLRRYYAMVIASVVIDAGLLTQLSGELLPPAAMFVPAFLGMLAFLWERQKVARVAPPAGSVREVELSSGEDHLPRWIVLALPPFAFPMAAAAWLRGHWDEIPGRFPIHWDANNVANRWADKSPRAVFGPLLYDGGLLLILILMALAMFYGSRRGRQRTAMVKMLVATNYLMALLFSGISLLPLVHFSPTLIIVPAVLFGVLMLAWTYRLVRDTQMPADATPDSCWYLGSFYVNAEDPAIFVQKRIGFGYTINMGNRLAWLFMGGFAAALVGLVFTLPR